MGEIEYTVTAMALYKAMIAFGELSDKEVAGLAGIPEEEVQNIDEENAHLMVVALLKKYFSDVAH